MIFSIKLDNFGSFNSEITYLGRSVIYLCSRAQCAPPKKEIFFVKIPQSTPGITKLKLSLSVPNIVLKVLMQCFFKLPRSVRESNQLWKK